jgi:hypothetical protein
VVDRITENAEEPRLNRHLELFLLVALHRGRGAPPSEPAGAARARG